MSVCKTRYLANNQQIIRVDEEKNISISNAAKKFILKSFYAQIKNKNVVILSDYNKGLLTNDVCREIIKISNKLKIPVIVDPKNKDFNIYKGASLVTPNQIEAGNIAQRECSTDKQAETCCRIIMNKYKIKSVMITRSEKGLTYMDNKIIYHAPTKKIEVYDVSGAGDTVLAILSVCFSIKLNIKHSLFLANKAAGIVIGKIGTSAVNKYDLIDSLKSSYKQKILSLKELKSKISLDRKNNLNIGFTNGCFDILHKGHITYLEESKELCDKLIIAINSDKSVRKIKGSNRPVNNEKDRAEVLASLSVSDYIIIFDQTHPLELIKSLKPDILTKGGDYKNKKIIGQDEVKEWGGKTKIMKKIEGASTTNILRRKN